MLQPNTQATSLTTQIIWRVGALSLIALIGILIALVAVGSLTLRSTHRTIREAVQQTSHALQQQLLETEQNLVTLEIALAYAEADDYRDVFQRTIEDEGQSSIFRAHFFAPDGDVIYQYQRIATDIPQPKPSNGLASWSDIADPTWGDITWAEADTPFWSVTFALPVNAPSTLPTVRQGERLGTLVAEVELTSFWDALRVLDVGGSKAYLIDPQGGFVLAHKNAEAALVQTTVDVQTLFPDFTPDTSFATRQLSSRIERGLEGNLAVIGVETLPSPPTLIVVEQPLSTALVGFYRAGAVLVILAGVGVWLIISVGAFVQRRIIVPLEMLHTHVEQFGQGDLSQRIHLTAAAGDEIDLLTRTFNRMADDIETRTHDLVAANQRAEESSRLKTEFLSMISHELRTPLNAIMGYSGILLEGLNGEMDPVAKNMVSRIDLNSHRLLHLISELLDLSRIESGEMSFDVKPFNPHDLAQTWDAQHRVLAAKQDLDFVVTVAPALPTTLYGDTKRLTQIVANLLSNALKFTRVGTITLELDYSISEWTIAVRDDGIGISEVALSYIFEKFRQGDSSSTREYGGTGLGLTIVDQLTNMMGGRVTVESKVNEGSCFTVHLPVITQSDPKLPGRTQHPRPQPTEIGH